jgi:CO dehydrogenase maturation factor
VKILICGKGGSGKSTLTATLARALNNRGKTVLVVDADESNLCLNRLLGARMPDVLMDAMGGAKRGQG